VERLQGVVPGKFVNTDIKRFRSLRQQTPVLSIQTEADRDRALSIAGDF
jgi:hypothetical protein